MIRIVATQNVAAQNAEKFEVLARELVECSRKEEGNVDYSCNGNIQNPTQYAFIEVWRDQAAVDKHMASEHFTRLFPQISELCENVSINLYAEI